jgi:hypothetical protein
VDDISQEQAPLLAGSHLLQLNTHAQGTDPNDKAYIRGTRRLIEALQKVGLAAFACKRALVAGQVLLGNVTGGQESHLS